MSKRLIRGLLFLGTVGLLLSYFITVNDLPARIYTSAQQEFLSYNYNRSIMQSALAMNVLATTVTGNAPDMLTRMPSSESHVRADIHARFEEREGVSVTIYDLEFQGQYQLTASASPTTTIELFFPFPGNLETLHDVQFTVDDIEPSNANYSTIGIHWRTTLQGNETHQIAIGYKANGANSFAYGLPQDQRTQTDVIVTVSGVSGSSVPRSSLPITSQTSSDESETFKWQYTGLIANRDIQLSLPTRLSFTQRIALLQNDFRTLAGVAPFWVGLFVACLAGWFSLNGLHFQVEGYLLTGLGVALFFPALTFTSGMMGIIPAAIATVIVVSGLLLVFLGSAIGWKKTWLPLSLLLLIFLGFFSLGMLTPWRGLSLTSGSLLLLGIFMWAYIRRPLIPKPVSPSQSEAITSTAADAEGPQPMTPPIPAEIPKMSIHAHCWHCGQVLEATHHFCPGCGYDTQVVRRCHHCKYLQYVPPDIEFVYCIQCGQKLSRTQ